MSVTIHCDISLEKACIIHVTTTYGIHIPCLHAQHFEQGFHCSTDFKYFLIDAHLIAHVKFCMDISVMLSDEDIKLNKFCCELSFEDEAILKFLITLNLKINILKFIYNFVSSMNRHTVAADCLNRVFD